MNDDVESALRAGFWSKLPREQVESLFAEGEAAEVPPGFLIPEDEGFGKIALMVTGLWRMFIRAKSGRQVTVNYAREGDTLGLTAALAGPCRAGLQSLAPSKLWVMSVETLKKHAFADAKFAWALAEQSGKITFEMVDELADNAFGSVRQRVARHLLDLVIEGPDHGLLAPISQQELANAVGTVREVVSRVLVAMRKEGVVVPTENGLQVLDAARLYESSQVSD